MDYFMLIILVISISSLFALVIYKLSDIKEEIKKQNECWQNFDKHFDRTVSFWINLIDYINKGDKNE